MLRLASRLAIPVAFVAIALPVAPASATSTGGCPSGDDWQMVTVASLGIDPETASGIPSLDGNGDGLTCIKGLANYPRFPNAFVFRDNTVGP
jgi:hypothetical protein